jgi:hypothetical protein
MHVNVQRSAIHDARCSAGVADTVHILLQHVSMVQPI